MADQTRIQEIRAALDAREVIRTHFDGCELSPTHRDCAIRVLLERLDARDTALRALIAEWREQAAKLASDAPERRSDEYGLMLRHYARQMVACADQLAALLEG